MKTTAYRIGILTLLLLPAAAHADTRWFQIPAHAAWIDVPAPWSVQSDKTAPMLMLDDGQGGHLEVWAFDKKSLPGDKSTAAALMQVQQRSPQASASFSLAQ